MVLRNQAFSKLILGDTIPPMRNVQQLVYDGKRLFCPDHPSQQLAEGKTSSERGTFSIFCPARMGEGNCMNSAEWISRDDMLRDLQTE
jgi:hypothetical protein